MNFEIIFANVWDFIKNSEPYFKVSLVILCLYIFITILEYVDKSKDDKL